VFDTSEAVKDIMIGSLEISSLPTSSFGMPPSIMGLSIASGSKESPTPRPMEENDYILLSFGWVMVKEDMKLTIDGFYYEKGGVRYMRIGIVGEYNYEQVSSTL